MSTVYRFTAALMLCFFATTGALAAEGTVNKIAAVVNGEMITSHELRNRTEAELARQKISLKDPRAATLQASVLEAMINDILLRQEAKRYKVTVSSADVEADLKKTIDRSGLSQKDFEAQIIKQGGTIALVKERISNNLLRSRMINNMIARKISVTPEEIADYYNKNKSQFAGQKMIDFSIIMLPGNLKVQNIYDQIRSGSLSFEDAARKYSADKSAEKGGRIGKVPWDRLPPELKKLMTSLADGKMTPLLKTKDGFLIFKRHNISDAQPETLAEATPRIENILREPRMEERFKEYTDQLRSKAVIDIRK